jgi:predicted TPR repeat methyltransferase
MSGNGLGKVYDLGSAADAEAFYDNWAEGYDAELAEGGYVTPQRCAEALAAHVIDPGAPLAEFGCGTGLGGLALRAAGFTCIDGFDISEEMLVRAGACGAYRHSAKLDLSEPLESINVGAYQNAAAIGVLNPSFMPPTVIDEIISKLPSQGCFVCSLNDNSAADGSFETRIVELVEYGVADLLSKDYGAHIPGIDLLSTVYVLKKR